MLFHLKSENLSTIISKGLLYMGCYLASDLNITMKEYDLLENINLGIFVVQFIVLEDI